MAIRWSDHARADLFVIAERDAEESADLSDTILLRIEAAAAPLDDQPRAGEAMRGGLHKWLVRKTPFLLIYCVIDRVDVEIVRVVRSSTDWKPRR